MSMRADLTEKIVRLKIERDLSWSGLAGLAPDLSKEFITAGLLGQNAVAEGGRRGDR